MFDKKIKRGIIHHARQRRTESACRFEFEIHHFIYFPTPLYTQTRCQAGFCVCWGFFYLFETIGRRGVSQSKCPEGGTRLPSGSWAGDGMPRTTRGKKLPERGPGKVGFYRINLFFTNCWFLPRKVYLRFSLLWFLLFF